MIKKLLKSVREYKKTSILAPIMISGEAIMEVVIPTLMANMIDLGIEPGDMSYVAKMGGLLVLAALVSLFFGIMAGRCASIASAGFAHNLRKDMYYRVQNFSFKNIDHFSTTSLVTRLTTDVANVQNTYSMALRMAIRSPMLFIFSILMSFRIDSRLAWIFICFIPVLVLGIWLISSHAHPIFRRVFKTYDKLNRVVQENLRGIRVVKSFVREDYEEKKFTETSEEIFKGFSKAEKLLAFNNPLMSFCVYACTLLISWFGAKLIIQSGNNPELGMTTGQLLAMISYTMQILFSLMMLSMIVVFYSISKASMERVAEVLDEEPDLHDMENPVYDVKDGSIEFDHVYFSYSDNMERCSLKDVSLSIKSGMTVGILGGTGSSKSTLVQLIPRLYDVTQGTLKVGGVDVREYDMKALRDQVAMVLQKNVLFAGTIKENMRWGNAEATDEEIVAACKVACADEFIQTFPDGYDTYIEQGGSNVSGGQKQRLCIARALLKKPKILILDDSTSAVDTKTDASIRSGFKTVIPETTKLIIAQRVASVEDADMILLLDNGEIVATGTHEELLKNSAIYREIAESQKKGATENV